MQVGGIVPEGLVKTARQFIAGSGMHNLSSPWGRLGTHSKMSFQTVWGLPQLINTPYLDDTMSVKVVLIISVNLRIPTRKRAREREAVRCPHSFSNERCHVPRTRQGTGNGHWPLSLHLDLHSYVVCSFGSYASLTASPMNVTVFSVTTIAVITDPTIHHASMFAQPCCNSSPQLGVGGGSPNPR